MFTRNLTIRDAEKKHFFTFPTFSTHSESEMINIFFNYLGLVYNKTEGNPSNRRESNHRN